MAGAVGCGGSWIHGYFVYASASTVPGRIPQSSSLANVAAFPAACGGHMSLLCESA